MIKIEYTQASMDALFEGMLNHDNVRSRRKMMTVYLKGIGIDHERICKICRLSRPTLASYLKEYRDDGMKGITRKLSKGHPSELNAYSKQIKDAFKEKSPATIKEAKAKIKEITGLDRSIPQVWSFLRKLGLRSRMVGGVPGRVDVAAQETFKKKNLSLDS